MLPKLFAAYRKRFPGVALELFDGLSDRCLEYLRQGRVDFALSAPGSRLAEFDSRLLFADPFYLVCRRDHPLASKRRVQLRDLAGHDLIDLARTSSVRQHLEPVLSGMSISHSGIEVEFLATVAGLVTSGLGISLVPDSPVPVPSTGIGRDSSRGARSGASHFVVQRKGMTLSPPAAQLLEMIEASLPVVPR